MKEILGNGLDTIVSQALQKMKEEQGESFRIETVNLAALQRMTGISRGRLRRWKRNLLSPEQCSRKRKSILSDYTSVLDHLLSSGISNTVICFERLKQLGYAGGHTTVKCYIRQHKHLIPAKRKQTAPQGNRGRRYRTSPGEAYQMDWGFVYVTTDYGIVIKCACFAMICHHCGQCYIEFFPNAKQENLFIGMIHAFRYMGIPKYILTDNMKSVVIKRDFEGRPIWQKDYEDFMKTVGFQTKLCKPRHPFTKGKVERLVRFVKENFLVGRSFLDITDLNQSALDWCNRQNAVYHRATDCVPQQMHETDCSKSAASFLETQDIFPGFLFGFLSCQQKFRKLRGTPFWRALPLYRFPRPGTARRYTAVYLFCRCTQFIGDSYGNMEQAGPVLQRPVCKSGTAGGVSHRGNSYRDP